MHADINTIAPICCVAMLRIILAINCPNPAAILIWEFSPLYRLDQETIWRQILALLDDGCDDRPAQMSASATLKPGKNELMVNGKGGVIKDLINRNHQLDIKFEDTSVKVLQATLWYLNGRHEDIKIEKPETSDTDGRFVFQMREDEDWASQNLLALEIQGRKPAPRKSRPSCANATTSPVMRRTPRRPASEATMNPLRTITAPALLALALFGPAAQAGSLVPPQGYYAGIEKLKKGDGNFRCEPAPKPYTGPLQFRSKYEGSDGARATLNKASEKAFRQSTEDITTLERGVSKMVGQYMRDGRPAQLDCALTWLGTWARADALASTDYNHTGKSMRKWALGSMSGSWLRLKFSNSQPLAAHQAEAELIEKWLARLAEQTVRDWSDLPLEKINNHSYWAAWSVMATAVATDRRDLFDWAVKEYKVGANRGRTGLLPNELKRKQRALAYHNYAPPPLAMIASFAQVNGVDVRGENNNALQRLAQRVLSGSKDPSAFKTRNGEKQDMHDLKIDSKYSWMEPYCSLYACSGDTLQRKRGMQPFNSFRLGGDPDLAYDPSAESKK